MIKKLFLSALFALVSLCCFAQTTVVVNVSESDAAVCGHDSYVPDFRKDGTSKRPLNVILMIGDGMGLGQLSTGMYANSYSLTITNLKTCGFVRTQSASDFTTDSGASGTAYATGYKTTNRYLGLAPDGSKLVNLPDKLSEAGIVSGIVTTDHLTGATPAAFYAHQPDRGMTNEIWADLPDSKLVFAAGGSLENYAEVPEETRTRISENFVVVNDLSDQSAKSSQKLCYLPSNNEVRQFAPGFNRGDFLPETTEYAISYLKERCNGRKGFFLMVEGAHIDHACHGNSLESLIPEVIDFDKAVEAAIRFAESDGNTLVIISADHETGGIVLENIGKEHSKVVFVSHEHSPLMVPLFAYGPSSDLLKGVQENSDVSNKIASLLLGRK